MIRAALRIFARVIGGVVGLAIVTYLAALAVNLKDEPPSEPARRFADLYASQPAVADEQNASIYVMGLEAPAGEDPYAAGLRRIAWLREVRAGRPFDERDDPVALGRHVFTRPPEAEELVNICGEDTAECVAAFAGASAIAEKWRVADGLLLPRYLELLTRAAWRDEFPDDLSVPLPPFGVAADAQRLLLLSAYSAAEREDAEEIRDRLEADLRFWRRVLESTDMLITKMVATAALNRHFEWGNLVLRRLDPGTAGPAIPKDWHTVLTDRERSMARTMTGEWLYLSRGLSSVDSDYLSSTDSWANRLPAHVISPLYQPQDTINRAAEYFWSLSEEFGAPLAEYPSALERASALMVAAENSAFARPFYNPLGNVVLSEASDFTQYAARVSDIEGVRRAALAAATLRDAAVAAVNVEAALRASELRNPYDDNPLQWDPVDGAIVFHGLQRGARGEHRLHY